MGLPYTGSNLVLVMRADTYFYLTGGHLMWRNHFKYVVPICRSLTTMIMKYYWAAVYRIWEQFYVDESWKYSFSDVQLLDTVHTSPQMVKKKFSCNMFSYDSLNFFLLIVVICHPLGVSFYHRGMNTWKVTCDRFNFLRFLKWLLLSAHEDRFCVSHMQNFYQRVNNMRHMAVGRRDEANNDLKMWEEHHAFQHS